ncbi:class I SAM-dependent methyltransferase [Peribacillus sp. SCS-37]|uniref:class I SAM-dependent methyltransferase n=1 Tax=Paraperibacillus esterisolvens TaxID=3115296 RepID=UPI0039069CE4
MTRKEAIHSHEDILSMLDTLLEEKKRFNWDSFYENRERKVPFFENLPDENLADYLQRGWIKQGKALDLGCGPGRNALFLARNGFRVDAVDSSAEAVRWGKERTAGYPVRFIKENIFNLDTQAGSYDVVYDSGCFHHIAPHRRLSYLEILEHGLKPGGIFALTCFAENGGLGGADISDWDVYRGMSLRGGLGFTEEKLKRIFSGFEVLEIRRMKDFPAGSGLFGYSDLWAGIFKKR